MSDGPALFRRFPELSKRIPWVRLGADATPVEPLPSSLAGATATAWVKRDDLTAESYGGNKARKLEFLLAEAERRGVRRLITLGAAGSHHALATAVHGSALGFRVTLVLFPQPRTPHVRDVLLADHALGAELRFTRRMETVPLAVLAARWAHRRENTYVIPAGGSNAIGTLGYASGALELMEQVDADVLPEPDAIHVAAGTLGTAAGLGLGLALAGARTRIRATRITGTIVTNERVLGRLVRGAASILADAGVTTPAPEDVLGRIEIRHGHIGAGYGRETEAGLEAAERFAGAGLFLDATYTAKAAADFLESAAAAASGEKLLFWHTLSAAHPPAARHARIDDLPLPFRQYLERTR